MRRAPSIDSLLGYGINGEPQNSNKIWKDRYLLIIILMVQVSMLSMILFFYCVDVRMIVNNITQIDYKIEKIINSTVIEINKITEDVNKFENTLKILTPQVIKFVMEIQDFMKRTNMKLDEIISQVNTTCISDLYEGE